MRAVRKYLVSFLFLAAPLWLASEDKPPADNAADPSSGDVTISGNASKQEVEQLRRQVAAQEKTIEELKSMVQRLADVKAQPADGSPSAPDAARMVTVALATPRDPGDVDTAEALASEKAAQTATSSMPSAGWNGEHFFLRSPDGQFTLLPVGYLNTNYSLYSGDGAPPDTFSVRRARFGLLGTYGDKVDYAFLFDAAATNGIAIRDMYLNFKPTPVFQIEGGQFKEPFSQEVGIGDTNVEFLERSIVSVLYPSSAGAFRAPGLAVHGDIDGGVVQYWTGIFNGKGLLANNTSNEPEVVGRLRFSPWKNHKASFFQGFSFGGSVAQPFGRHRSGTQLQRRVER